MPGCKLMSGCKLMPRRGSFLISATSDKSQLRDVLEIRLVPSGRSRHTTLVKIFHQACTRRPAGELRGAVARSTWEGTLLPASQARACPPYFVPLCRSHNNNIVTTHTLTGRTCKMVQLFDHGGWPRAGPNDYWKLDTGIVLSGRNLRENLREKNFSVLKSVNKARLRVLYARCQRGLPSYEGMSLRELRFYATRHALTISPKATTTVIKTQLEKADDDATFDRFSDLPPELRRMAFQYYYDSLPFDTEADNMYAQNVRYPPPVTRTSHMFRRESLPFFYDRCDFGITSTGSSKFPYKLSPCPRTARFIESTAIHDFARIKSLRLTFTQICVNLRLNSESRTTRCAT